MRSASHILKIKRCRLRCQGAESGEEVCVVLGRQMLHSHIDMTEVAQEMLCNRSSICVSRVLCCEAYGGCGADTRPVCTVGYMQHPALVAGDDEAVQTEQVSGGRRSHAQVQHWQVSMLMEGWCVVQSLQFDIGVIQAEHWICATKLGTVCRACNRKCNSIEGAVLWRPKVAVVQRESGLRSGYMQECNTLTECFVCGREMLQSDIYVRRAVHDGLLRQQDHPGCCDVRYTVAMVQGQC